MGGIFRRVGAERASRWVKPVEALVKKPIFDCRMCGQCILHSTGMTCPMTCPKQIRNGPCGGVRMDGTCEVDPRMDCIWVKAVGRAAKTDYHLDIAKLNPPADWRLQNTASWVTHAIRRDEVAIGSGEEPHHALRVISR
jgi:Methylene-tetrahydrofolate reductase C terminal